MRRCHPCDIRYPQPGAKWQERKLEPVRCEVDVAKEESLWFALDLAFDAKEGWGRGRSREGKIYEKTMGEYTSDIGAKSVQSRHSESKVREDQTWV